MIFNIILLNKVIKRWFKDTVTILKFSLISVLFLNRYLQSHKALQVYRSHSKFSFMTTPNGQDDDWWDLLITGIVFGEFLRPFYGIVCHIISLILFNDHIEKDRKISNQNLVLLLLDHPFLNVSLALKQRFEISVVLAKDSYPTLALIQNSRSSSLDDPGVGINKKFSLWQICQKLGITKGLR